MKRNIWALILAAMMIAVMIMGCGEKKPSEAEAPETSTEEAADDSTEEPTEEPTTEEPTEKAELVGIFVITWPDKVEYQQNESVDTTGLVLNLKYANNKYDRITEGFTIEEPNMSSAGTKKVKVLYEGFETDFEIRVLPQPSRETVIGEHVVFGGASYQVIAKDGPKSLLVADQASTTRSFHAHSGSKWADSAMRDYLNSDFYNAIPTLDRAKIMLTVVVTPKNEERGTGGGPDSEDYVFLLSVNEVEEYMPTEASRKTTFNGAPNVWWLRTPGVGSNTMCYVDENGVISTTGLAVSDVRGVRPAMWVIL